MRLEVELALKNEEFFQRWLSDPATRDFVSYLRSQVLSNKLSKATVNVSENSSGTSTVRELTLTASSSSSAPAYHHLSHHYTPQPNERFFSSRFHESVGDHLLKRNDISGEIGSSDNWNKGPVADRVISSVTQCRSSLVDLWPARSVHVTSLCERGANGDSCQATHFGLSDSLFDNGLQQLDELMTMAAPPGGNNSDVSSSWKATFMSTRQRFSSPSANPIQLKLGGRTSNSAPNKNWATSPPPQAMSTSDDWSSFEKLFGERQSGLNGGNVMVTSTGSSRAALTPSPTPSNSCQPVYAPGNVDNATAKEIETRFVALNDLIRGITFLGTNGVASPNTARSTSPAPVTIAPHLNRNSSPAANPLQNQQLSRQIQVQKSSFSNSIKTHNSMSSLQPVQGNNHRPSNLNGDISREPFSTPVKPNLTSRRIPPDLVLFDSSANVNTKKDTFNNALDDNADSDRMALKIIDEVQQFLQTNTETLKKCGRFPTPTLTPVTPTSPTAKNPNLSDQLTRQVVDDRYPSAGPLSPSASSVVRRAMLDHYHFHHQRTSSVLPRQQHVSTGSVAERVNQFEHSRQIKGPAPTGAFLGNNKLDASTIVNETRPFFHFQLPNSVAGVSASIIHQPSVITSAAASSAKLVNNGSTYQQRQVERNEKVETQRRSEEIKDEKRNRAVVLNEIEKALQGIPARTSAAGSSAGIDKNVDNATDQRSPNVNGAQSDILTANPKAPTASFQNGGLSLRSLLNRQSSKQQISNETAETMINKTAAVFRTLPAGKAELADFDKICKACGLPTCMKKALFNKCSGKKAFAVQYDLTRFWTSLGEDAGDIAVVLIRLLCSPAAQNRYLVQEDFIETVQTIVDDHPGLGFLREAPEFHSRYIQTVIARIFFCVNRSWTGRLTAAEIRRSNLIDVLRRLDEEDDINRITDYFSYEHFYVVYCKFWELDRDHDLLIDKEDLSRFDDYALSRRAVDQIFTPALNNDRKSLDEGKMTYPQFVRFILAEKDKRHPTSIEYWFRCMDLDGDGVISIYELQHFYDEQAEKMILCGIEPMPFVDILCQVMDMVRPRIPLKISLADLKQCKMATVFFDTFLNLHRYLEHEQVESGGGVNAAMRNEGRDGDDTTSEWNLYAAEEYEALVAEEADLGTEIKCDSDDEER